MKIKYLEVNKYLQFKDFKLELTYPEGHDKAGQPLEKVCFIGQSGTGKTSLLNLIRAIVCDGLSENSYVNPLMESVNATSEFGENNVYRSTKINKGKVQTVINQKVDTKNSPYREGQKQEFLTKYYQKSNILVSFSSEMNINLPSIFPENNQKGFVIPQNVKDTPSVSEGLNIKIFDFESSNIETVWNLILNDIQKHNLAQLSYYNELVNHVGSGEIDERTQLSKYVTWKKKNPNPLTELANKLNEMLNRFNLEIKSEFAYKTIDELRFIQIHQKRGNSAIPYSGWSTGTKQLIMTATPLLKLNTDKAVILIDEPERSFYPDIQRDLMGFYKVIAPKAQFFIATHSPIIAASFDPWEIVELKFNEEGNIVQEQYFEGERHVDNYKIHPKYLRWDSILTRLFDLEQDGMPDRQRKIRELSELDVRLQKMKKANGAANPQEVKALWERFKQTAELLDWKIKDYHEEN
jgi:ABC-type lipoprotein export system ATPase subunit